MSAIKFGLIDVKQQMRRLFGAQWALFAGAAFIALAMVSIEYEEVIAPGLSRVSGAWSSATLEIGRKLTFSLSS